MRIESVSANTTVQKAPEQKAPQRAPASVANAAKGSTNVTSNAAQEALETVAQTKKEAANGDQQAVRKLAQETAAQQSRNVAQSGIGRSINTKA